MSAGPARPQREAVSPTALPALSVCIVNYQGADVLEKTLDAVRAVDAPIGQILVVDNGSTDGSAELAAGHDDVRLIRLPENLGPGAARNVAWAHAANDLVLFLDNDVVPEPQCPGRLAAELLAAGATLAMPRVLIAHDPATIQYDGAKAHFSGLLAYENAGLSLRAGSEDPRELQSLVSACFLIDRRRWAGPLFDEILFYLLEDHDMALRARIAGGRILSVPSARCLHGSGTPGLSLRRIGRYTDVRIVNLLRNRWVVLLKNYRLRSLVVLSPALFAFECFQLAGAIRKGWFRQWASSVVWVFRHGGRIFAARRAVQRSRAVGDGEILSGGPFPFAERLLEGRLERAAGRWLDRLACGWWRIARPWL